LVSLDDTADLIDGKEIYIIQNLAQDAHPKF
jgi:hypothetical protein